MYLCCIFLLMANKLNWIELIELTPEKQTTLENCYFLVKLAHEYQMDAIVKKCEDILVRKLKTKPKDGVLAELIFAQTYELEKLRQASVKQAHNLKLEELKSNEMYDQIQPENLREIMEGIITRLQRELEESQRTSQQRQQKIDALEKTTSKTQTLNRDTNYLSG